MPGKTADEYIREHWIPRKVWNNLQAPKHQERLKKCAELTRGTRLCDVGCACGHSTDIMRGFRPGEWRGIDFSATAIRMAPGFFPDIPFGYIPNLDGLHNLKRFKLDSIVCSEVLEHCGDDRKLVTGLYDAVSERVVFTTPSVKVNDPGHIRLYDEAMLAVLFEGIPHTVENTGLFWYIVCDKDSLNEIFHGQKPEEVEALAPIDESVEVADYLIPPDEEAAPVVEEEKERQADESFASLLCEHPASVRKEHEADADTD